MNTHFPKTQGAVSVLKTVKLLEHIAAATDGLIVSELVTKTGQSKSAIHRMLASLVQCGWLVTRPVNGCTLAWFISAEFIGLAYQWKRCALAGAAMSGDCFMSASTVSTSKDVVMKAVQLFHLVLGGGIKGKTLDELHIQAGCPRTTTYRLLCTWEQLGWLKSVDVNGRSERWCASERLVQIAHQFEQQQRNKIFDIKESYQTITGEAL